MGYSPSGAITLDGSHPSGDVICCNIDFSQYNEECYGLTGLETCAKLSARDILTSPPHFRTKRMETLEFLIYPDGRVQEKVTGIVGKSCAEVTAKIEAQLGRVVTQTPSAEFFAPTIELRAEIGSTVTAQNTSTTW
jgi:hypothetical protein